MNSESHDRASSGFTEVFRKATSQKRYQTKQKVATPFSLRLTAQERACLNEQAGSQPLGAYIRSRLLGEHTEKRRPMRRPSPDQKKLALILSELGRSRLSSNMNQLAKAANTGILDVSEPVICDIQAACRAITVMREMLIAALGVKPEHDK